MSVQALAPQSEHLANGNGNSVGPVEGNNGNGNGNGHAIQEEEDLPQVDITINNTLSTFTVRCHLNLRDIALRGANVEYRREQGVSVYIHLHQTDFTHILSHAS